MFNQTKREVYNLISESAYYQISVQDLLNNYEIHFREQQMERMLLISRLRATGEILKRENLNAYSQVQLLAHNICRYHTLTKGEIDMERNKQLSLQQQAKVINATTTSISSNSLRQPSCTYYS